MNESRSDAAARHCAAQFAEAVARFDPPGSIAVAVSGGSDSMALLHLAARWAAGARRSLRVLTVDHGLRPEAAAEAERVAEWAGALGLETHVLKWRGGAPGPRLQERARAARYRLLASRCEAEGIGALLVGHTEDDVAETFLQRLARGAGLDGLAGMAPEIRIAAGPGAPIRLLRPLLGFSRAQLRGMLDGFRQTYLEDPSNADDAFERVRIRNARRAFAALGLEFRDVARSAARLRAARAALDRSAAELFAQAGAFDDLGGARLGLAALRDADRAVAARCLRKAVAACAGTDHPPNEEKVAELLEAIFRAMRGPRRQFRATLGGAVVEADADADADAVLLRREPAAVTGRMDGAAALAPAPIATGSALLWDGRFIVALEGQTAPEGQTDHAQERFVAPLGERAVEFARGEDAKRLAAAPAIFANGEVLAAPGGRGARPEAAHFAFIGGEKLQFPGVIRF
ncbi:MAG: tRNA lysidine(34) synthetase TilS [Parvularculaceae bacterium]